MSHQEPTLFDSGFVKGHLFVLHLPGHRPGAIGILAGGETEGWNFLAGDVFASWRRPAAP
jgi:glyoxylase-like metal-dependent hydrolase (beta-lactamase superfamily II)